MNNYSKQKKIVIIGCICAIFSIFMIFLGLIINHEITYEKIFYILSALVIDILILCISKTHYKIIKKMERQQRGMYYY